MRHLTDYLKEYPNCISDDLCDDMIRRFELDHRKQAGSTSGGIDEVKKSTDLVLSKYRDWNDVDTALFESLSPKIEEYLELLSKETNFSTGEDTFDTGYQIQRTCVGEFYDWHQDFISKGILRNRPDKPISIDERIVTYIFYLNDNFEGGQTQFFGDEKVAIIPTKGKLLLFPANPLYGHRGSIVTKGAKYICTGWLYSTYFALS